MDLRRRPPTLAVGVLSVLIRHSDIRDDVLADLERGFLTRAVEKGRLRATAQCWRAVAESDLTDVLAVEEALQRPEERNPRMTGVAECRLFGGMSVPETVETCTRLHAHGGAGVGTGPCLSPPCPGTRGGRDSRAGSVTGSTEG